MIFLPAKYPALYKNTARFNKDKVQLIHEHVLGILTNDLKRQWQQMLVLWVDEIVLL